jgi:hypothetical protein
MNKRSKLAALLGAGLLTFGIAGVVLANDLGTDHPNQVNTSLNDLIANEGVVEDCSDFTGDLAVGEGQVGLHFTLTPELSADTGNISGSVDGTAFGPVANTVHGGGGGVMHFYVIVDGDGDSVIDSASTDVTGGTLQLSHICFGAPGGGGSGDTDQPPTDALAAPTGSSGPTDTAWLLVVALGVLLASIVVLTPARAKSKR